MTLLLSSQNVGNYLFRQGLCTTEQETQLHIELVAAKNFNLRVSLPDGSKLLVKQERQYQDGKTFGEFLGEWRVQEFLNQFPELDRLRPLLPIVLNFDPENSIIVFRYLDDYQDLTDFYAQEKNFPSQIASAIGTVLATIHRATLNRQNYQEFLDQNQKDVLTGHVPNLIRGLERIGPEIFGGVPVDALKFFSLYQRYDSLGLAIKELGSAFAPCCLTHHDLKLNNILLHTNWEQSSDSIVRFIDWERCNWGDPAFDLGTLIASYLEIWLNSLVISNALSIEESLRLAATPLEVLQPSIAVLTLAYFDTFPEILQQRPDFLRRVVQFAGLVLIQQILAMIQFQKTFGNIAIIMLQVAKTLLCRPEQSMSTTFGTAAAESGRLSCTAA
ncbi:MAG: phosphotransferase [Nostoc sp. DedVER02]|uniref:phosphotransferase n=1 Tax=unclassified Nostoc TaxID=2593658 RepID=UPI002AD393B9|nr:MULTISPECIES: phosphotransferase [unclassified Nostoc]MDZ7989062.1 phosphotransferase [Nostoc sp. DedVER02]MDZ8111608.1 phosphotransferase [Nostoc sp. DedVER01b]